MTQSSQDNSLIDSPIIQNAKVEDKVIEIQQSKPNSAGTYSTHSILPEVFQRIEVYSKGGFVGYQTGFRDLECMTGGFMAGDLVILGGLPGMGKTSLALSIARHLSIDSHKKILYVSTKDSRQTLVQRLLVQQSMVNGHLMRVGRLPRRDYPRLSIAVGPIHEAPLEFFCEPRVTIKSIIESAKALKNDQGLDMIFVDHLQMVLVNPVQQNKYEDVTIVVNELKRLARELDVVVVALSAMNRTARDRSSPEPRLSDLGDSGAIETTSDTVMLLNRPEVFDDEAEKGKAELIIAKQNSGPTGKIPLTFVSDYATFLNYSSASNEK